MKREDFFLYHIYRTIKLMLRNPILILFSFFIFIFFSLVFHFFGIMFSNVKSKIEGILLFLMMIICLLSVASFFMTMMIGYAIDAIKKKNNLKKIFRYSSFFISNMILLIIIIFFSQSIVKLARLISDVSESFIGNYSNILGAFFVLLGFLGFISFFSFCNVFLIGENLSVLMAIKKSFAFVKKNYFSVILMLFFFLLVSNFFNQFSSFIESYLMDLIYWAVLFPISILTLVCFVYKEDDI